VRSPNRTRYSLRLLSVSHRLSFPCRRLDLPREILEASRKYLVLNEQKKALESRLEILKNDILTFADGAFKAASDGILINVTSVAESVMIDSFKLKRIYPDIYDQVTKPKAGFVKLEIKPFTPLAAQAA